MAILVAWVQGTYYLITGIWPLLSVRTFMLVTGPKTYGDGQRVVPRRRGAERSQPEGSPQSRNQDIGEVCQCVSADCLAL
jgi:hypothetical protein